MDYYDTRIDQEKGEVVLSVYEGTKGGSVHIPLSGSYVNLNQLEVAVRQSFAHMHPSAKAGIPTWIGRKY